MRTRQQWVSFLIRVISLANKISVQGSSLIFDPVRPSGGYCGDLDDGRAKPIVTRLRSEMRTVIIPRVRLVRGDRTRIPQKHG